jgi:hypothetical protein
MLAGNAPWIGAASRHASPTTESHKGAPVHNAVGLTASLIEWSNREPPSPHLPLAHQTKHEIPTPFDEAYRDTAAPSPDMWTPFRVSNA